MPVCQRESSSPSRLQSGQYGCIHEGLGGVQVSGGTEIPDVETLTPGLITLPPIIVAPRLTLSGPTEGGTNVSSGDPAACGGAEVVSALATPTGAARQNTVRAAAAPDNFLLSILWFPFFFCVTVMAEPQGEALVLQALRVGKGTAAAAAFASVKGAATANAATTAAAGVEGLLIRLFRL
jgi:hypothetical protein